MVKEIKKQNKTEREIELDEIAHEELKRHIKSEMKLHGVSAPIVAERLTDMGRPITAQGLRNKISKGAHQTMWYWDLMKAIRNELSREDCS
ncbi:DUF6471 domain-containing protein [Vibrio alginolyticus]|uniref:DUF6471 domain-containing protein n=1 Tax=Vibrio alginolyticus TaxID=663 RepID=UPI0015F5CEE6|nr:DUF6471 domain-containing protein [Vibrio alginolyticus]